MDVEKAEEPEIKLPTSAIPDSGMSSGGGNGNPFQYSCLESPMDRGARWATVHRITKESGMSEEI